jgi:hypothetical protein
VRDHTVWRGKLFAWNPIRGKNAQKFFMKLKGNAGEPGFLRAGLAPRPPFSMKIDLSCNFGQEICD